MRTHGWLLACLPLLMAAAPQAAEKPPPRIGEIIIVGNTVTRDQVIRYHMQLYPGQILRYPEICLAEQNLARINLFVVDPAKRIRPTISIIDDGSGSEYKTILVQVKEKYRAPPRALMFANDLLSYVTPSYDIRMLFNSRPTVSQEKMTEPEEKPMPVAPR
jgi:hypothetical protein